MKNKKAANRGGAVAGKARKNTEKELGRSVISKENYLPRKSTSLLVKKTCEEIEIKEYKII
ncbi:hypothetical protein KKB43_04265 [Patescibacteria group bacterium]|nr:hypothetical protein [Patescibacteria group bacterium]MBU4580203.1 hypothetical protein [Patescibacteria group bacterium]